MSRHGFAREGEREIRVPEMTSKPTIQLAREQGNSAGFDYSCLEPAVVKFLRGHANRIRQYGTKSIIQIGKDLIGAKRYLSHGKFQHWVEHEAGIPRRTAQTYMQVASWASSKSATVALLPPTALYVLSSSRVPIEFVESVLKRVEAGEPIRTPSLRAQLRALRENSTLQNKCNLIPDEGSGDRSEVALGSHSTTATAAMISNAVQTLVRALSVAEFEHVRRIITSKAVLDDPSLPRLLERAFDSFGPSTTDSYEPKRELELCSTDWVVD
jgi:hypothetical protein